MELKNIYEIWDRFENSTASEMELDMNGVHFSLKKNVACVTNGSGSSNPAGFGVAGSAGMTGVSSAGASGKEEKSGVTAPLVGTFYAASSPDAEPFVKVGDMVHAGDVVGIIEAMKLMNEVKSPVDGKVKEILVDDESMVEYGQLLIVIE